MKKDLVYSGVTVHQESGVGESYSIAHGKYKLCFYNLISAITFIDNFVTHSVTSEEAWYYVSPYYNKERLLKFTNNNTRKYILFQSNGSSWYTCNSNSKYCEAYNITTHRRAQLRKYTKLSKKYEALWVKYRNEVRKREEEMLEEYYGVTNMFRENN